MSFAVSCSILTQPAERQFFFQLLEFSSAPKSSCTARSPSHSFLEKKKKKKEKKPRKIIALWKIIKKEALSFGIHEVLVGLMPLWDFQEQQAEFQGAAPALEVMLVPPSKDGILGLGAPWLFLFSFFNLIYPSVFV